MPTPIKTVQEHQAAPVEKQSNVEVVVEKNPEQSPLRLVTTAFIQASAGSSPPHSRLGHLPASQRSGVAQRVGQVSSNSLLQRLLQSQTSASNAIVHRTPVTIKGTTASTNLAAASLINLAIVIIKQEMQDVPPGEQAYTEAALAVEEGQVHVNNFSGLPDEEIEDNSADLVTRWYVAYTAASDGLNNYQKRQAAEKIKEGIANAGTMEEEAAEARSAFDFPMEQAFAHNDTERLEKLNNGINALASARSSVSVLKQVLLQAYSMVLAPAIKARDLIVGMHPIKPFIQQVVAAYKAANATITLISGGEGTTQSEQDASKITAVIDATSSVATLLGVASGYMVAIGAILPIGSALVKAVAAFQKADARQPNQVLMANMELDLVSWEFVPGGRATFEFMIRVMPAGDPSGVPLPLPPMVNSFFIDARKKLEAGTGSELPTTGWIWKDVDPKKIQSWVFQNRINIWSMLYGDLRVPGVYT